MPPVQLVIMNEGVSMVGSLFLPETGEGPYPVVVFLHGFTGDRTGPGFLLARCARRLAEAGIAGLTFDFRGSGESDGDFRQMTPASEISDAIRVIEYVGGMPGVDGEKVGVVGFSMGGYVACHAMKEKPEVKAGVLWAPAVYMRFLAGRQLGEAGLSWETVPQGGIPYGNLMVGKGFFDGLKELESADAACKQSNADILVIHGEEDETAPVDLSLRLMKKMKERNTKTELEIIEGADHCFAGPGNAERLFDLTVKWLSKHLKG